MSPKKLLPKGQAWMIVYLAEHGPTTSYRAAKRIGSSYSTIRPIYERLERKGLAYDWDGKGSYYVTPAGLAYAFDLGARPQLAEKFAYEAQPYRLYQMMCKFRREAGLRRWRFVMTRDNLILELMDALMEMETRQEREQGLEGQARVSILREGRPFSSIVKVE